MTTTTRTFTAIIVHDADGYIGWIEEFPGANTQGATLEEVRANLQEAACLVLKERRAINAEETAGRDVRREPLQVTV
jgi:predicted RNase H-like HicB family nuclease